MTRQRSNRKFAEAVNQSLALVAAMFVIVLLDSWLPLHLTRFGIVPRTASGLWGILCGPLLHANMGHFAANAVPLLVLLLLLTGNPRYRPGATLTWIWLGSGLGTWLIGRGPAVHLGASSLIFGLAAFLIVAGWQLRTWSSVAVALFVAIGFGGLFYGVLPRNGPISWEGHLCGMVAGILTARHNLRSR